MRIVAHVDMDAFYASVAPEPRAPRAPVVVGADPKGGAVDNGVRFFASATCHHRPEVYGGIAESEAAALLRDFFKARR